MKKIAIYARYSDSKQNPKSVDDQIADCLRYMQKHHLGSDPLIFTDCAITGQHANRNGYHRHGEYPAGRLAVSDSGSKVSIGFPAI
ncbi:MAG: recombinase family protein [Alphaproteobacteria bacterium]|nr:recombinase family protein [Alphaproteobacteria bacterium]